LGPRDPFVFDRDAAGVPVELREFDLAARAAGLGHYSALHGPIIADMISSTRALLLILGALALPALAQPPAAPCKPGDHECGAKAVEANPAKKLAYWSAAMAKPVEERIGAAPNELIDLLTAENVRLRLPNKPRSPTLSEEFLADVRAAFTELPETLRKRAAEKLAGIYFADDMGSTGFTDQIYDAGGVPKAAFVLLDPSVLDKYTANGWATWKENTPFRPDSALRLEAIIEDSANDNRMSAIQYILLHEIAHVLSVGAQFHPNWNIAPARVRSTSEFPFFEQSWFVSREEQNYASHFDYAFPQRKSIVYYSGARLPGSAMLAAYERLDKTNFPTLYAATHPADDFAESLASFVHTVILKKPFEIRIYRDGEIAKRYGSCWTEARCAEKRRILEEFLGAV
jgi:hypothetical protein